MKREAWFDDERNRTYRYLLRYTWKEDASTILFIMLNPSTADGIDGDPTVNNCVEYATRMNGGILEVVNLFAFITPSTKVLFDQDDDVMVGPETDDYILEAIKRADQIVVAWGADGHSRHRNHHILNMLKHRKSPKKNPILCLGTTRHGHPKHPGRKKPNLEIQQFTY